LSFGWDSRGTGSALSPQHIEAKQAPQRRLSA
jgi:hypothetical protein